MSLVIKIEGYADGGRSPYDGRFIVEYDATYVHGTYGYDGGLLRVSSKLKDAKRFADVAEALAFWKTVAPEPYSVRCDGKPNRPLTAFTVSVFDPDKSRNGA